MLDQRMLARSIEQAMIDDPQRDRELAVAEQQIAAAAIKLLGIAQEVVHHNVGRIERDEVLEKSADVSFGIVIADAAVEHFGLDIGRAEHSLEPRGRPCRPPARPIRA